VEIDSADDLFWSCPGIAKEANENLAWYKDKALNTFGVTPQKSLKLLIEALSMEAGTSF